MNCRVKRASSRASAKAAFLLSNCHTSSACSTQVLPVPVAILRQYLGCACLPPDTSASREPVSSASGATRSYNSRSVLAPNTSCATMVFKIACRWPGWKFRPTRLAVMSSPNHQCSSSAVAGVTRSNSSAAPLSNPRHSRWVWAVSALLKAS
jgi:hypothetical protein